MFAGNNFFWRLITEHPELGEAAIFRWDPIMVTLSVVVACVAGFATLMVMDRIQETEDYEKKRNWLIVGSFAMGIGVWAMHFTGMLALIVTMAEFSFRVQIQYDLLITLLSVIPAIIGSGFAIHFMSWNPVDLNWINLNLGALPLALGIGTMHYSGMEAMLMPAHLRYKASLFVLSIVVAHILSVAALLVKFQFEPSAKKTESESDQSFSLVRIVASCCIGFAVSGMHYTAMYATRIYPDPALSQPEGIEFPPLAMGSVICLFTVLILSVIVAGNRYYREETETAVSG